MTDVTRILNAIDQGDRDAAAQLWTLVYEELRRLAAQQLAREAPGHTLQTTALVHEAYLRLVGTNGDQHWQNRGHFFGAAAEAMRRILVDNARSKRAGKRGGGRQRVDLNVDELPEPNESAELLALDEALNRLATAEPQVAQLVKLRYFAGLTVSEAAAALRISPRTADAWWAYARAWLLARCATAVAELVKNSARHCAIRPRLTHGG